MFWTLLKAVTKRALLRQYTEQIERLKQELAASQEKNGVYLVPEEYEKMKERLEELETNAAARLVADKELKDTLRELRNDLEDQIALTAELKDKNLGLKKVRFKGAKFWPPKSQSLMSMQEPISAIRIQFCSIVDSCFSRFQYLCDTTMSWETLFDN